mmetsp:Transcript_52823/g.150595  ORF Transcript_52823/g.150595 Transcript_52823/m.150595 type:complete len:423 (+) Transcript_52823:46-1314(+)
MALSQPGRGGGGPKLRALSADRQGASRRREAPPSSGTPPRARASRSSSRGGRRLGTRPAGRGLALLAALGLTRAPRPLLVLGALPAERGLSCTQQVTAPQCHDAVETGLEQLVVLDHVPRPRLGAQHHGVETVALKHLSLGASENAQAHSEEDLEALQEESVPHPHGGRDGQALREPRDVPLGDEGQERDIVLLEVPRDLGAPARQQRGQDLDVRPQEPHALAVVALAAESLDRADQRPEGPLLVAEHDDEHGRYEVQALAVADPRVVQGEGPEHTPELRAAGGGTEGAVAREGPRQVALDLLRYPRAGPRGRELAVGARGAPAQLLAAEHAPPDLRPVLRGHALAQEPLQRAARQLGPAAGILQRLPARLEAPPAPLGLGCEPLGVGARRLAQRVARRRQREAQIVVLLVEEEGLLQVLIL